MNDVIAWTTEKWLTNTTTGGQGTVIWYYVARYDRTEEVHILFRFYESISPLEHPKLSTKKADLELRVRRSISKELTSYHLFEKEENGLKPIRSFTNSIDLIIYLDTVGR